MNASTDNLGCQSEQIAAYLDGELDGNSSTLLEEHLKECSRCTAELTEQRQLLCSFDSALGQSGELPLPKDFAQIVAAHAESDMSGVRGRAEHKRALTYCVLLATASFALLGAASINLVFGVGRTIVHRASVVFDLVWTTAYDAVAGMAVISRVLSKGFIPESHLAGFVIVSLLLALAVVLLSRLIASYHRTRLSE
jgi:predicted anti-sigma-YlaC factor YlaD